MAEIQTPSKELINLSKKFNRMFKKRNPYGYFALSYRDDHFKGWEIPYNGGRKVDYDRKTPELAALEASLSNPHDIEERINDAIEHLKRTKPTHIELEAGKRYQTLEETEIAGIRFEKGAKFEVRRARKPWKKCFELVLVSGKIKTGREKIFYGKKSLQPNPEAYGMDFITAEEFTEKTGIDFKDTRVFYSPSTYEGHRRYERVKTARA